MKLLRRLPLSAVCIITLVPTIGCGKSGPAQPPAQPVAQPPELNKAEPRGKGAKSNKDRIGGGATDSPQTGGGFKQGD
ncbi:hypothetical protein GobsT_05620 [Gemmata obscuriglobus]|uniref:hypothetical protein n=1 Tax=Gemmata obscuriglobus TaxID=114 RepID=UPI0011CD17CC|nr:hypothetical protein [Gemmata obscuriglobus]QEG25827.1 hypothetical protein GobsT_05620 [Gemmata obscuriglobus]VTR99760.1 unnamed protein product [Gemmata obscuriglobus UQM 2246]